MSYTARIIALVNCSALLISSNAAIASHRASFDVPAAEITFTQTGQMDGATAELVKGKALLRRGRAAEALIRLENALKLFKGANNKRGEAATHDLLGELYERQGRYDIALQHFNTAHEIFTAAATTARTENVVAADAIAGESSYNANLMLAKIGNMHYRQNKVAEARAAYGRMNVRKPEINPVNVMRNAQSKVSRARGLGARLRGIATGTPSTSTGSEAAGTATEAANIVTQPAELYRQAIIYATYELGLGRVDYLNEEFDEARKHFGNALAATLGSVPVIGKLGQMRRYRTAARTSLADIALREGRFAEAVKLYGEAAKGAKDDGRLDLMWPAQRGTGRSLWSQAAHETEATRAAKLREDALVQYREALASIEAIRQGSLHADEARTTFLATTKDVFDEASGALAEMALLSANANATNAAPLAGMALQYAAEAFRIVEGGRARSLLDLLNEGGASITEGVPADLLKRKQENQEQQEAIAAQLNGIQMAGDGAASKSPDQLESELNRLQTEFDSLENQIRAASPRYAALTATQPLTLAEIQQQVLDEGTALLEYSLGAEHSYLWAVTRGGVNLYKLPARSALEGQVAALRDHIIPKQLRRSLTNITAETNDAQRGLSLDTTTPAPTPSAKTPGAKAQLAKRSSGRTPAAKTPAAKTPPAKAPAPTPLPTPITPASPSNVYSAAAVEFYKTAVAPAASVTGERRLLIVADGALNYVPFEALVTSAEGADYGSLPYLINRNEIVYAPSASVIAAVRQQAGAAASAGRDLLLVADPVFNASDTRARGGADAQEGSEAARGLALASAVSDIVEESAPGAEAGGGGAQIARLPGTRAEAQGIAQLARGANRQADIWLDLDASEANIETRDLKRYRVVHVATHGILDAERPQFTGLVLSLVGNKDNDGFLRTDEVFNLRLGSPLVMLSACETGLGKEKRGEGIIGLTRAFMYAGAPTIGVSLWSVADRSTADLMTDFYRRLLMKEGTSATAAMRDAQRAMIAGKKYSAPFFWSPFVLVGDWR